MTVQPVYNFCLLDLTQAQIVVQSYSGGSIGGAVKLNHGQADVVINWSGGLHHAKKAEVVTIPSALKALIAFCSGLRTSYSHGLLSPRLGA